jgi:cbb3-type cytochrome oxidase cytochrome c subunit
MHDRRHSTVAGVVAVAGTYIYFLLFAQYGFVRLIEARGGGPVSVDRAMACMGVAGLLASFGTALVLRRRRPRSVLLASFGGCATAAALALAPSPAVECVAAVLIGAFTASLTVTLASCLRGLIGPRHFGLMTGIGTGLAYGICNVPALFDGPPLLQTAACILACLAGLTAVATARWRDDEPGAACPGLGDDDLRGLGLAGIVLAFLALVWLDSTAFATIQHTTELKGRTWGGPSQQILMGAVHVVAAVAAGALADAGLFRGLLFGTFLVFAAAFRMLHIWGTDATWAGPLYVAGISTYSVALVLFPSARPDTPGTIPARWRSALVYGIAGWLGSALGVGMAQHLHRIPVTLVIAAATVILGGLILAQRAAVVAWTRRFALVAVAGIAGIAVYARGHAGDPALPAVERGREVYIQEGCITCHSQFVRPHGPDAERWGPYHPPDFNERPPLIGNRRQGPDLMNAGIRRHPDWQRLHLEDPRSVSPGSSMPAYAHLFRNGSTRGDDLVAYLSTLGAPNRAQRLSDIAAWKPTAVGRPEAGRVVFDRWCTPCHGPDARGDGPYAARFNRPAANLRKGGLVYTAAPAGTPDERDALARIIRFGLDGSPMPGHELLSDREVADAASFVQSLNRAPATIHAATP